MKQVFVKQLSGTLGLFSHFVLCLCAIAFGSKPPPLTPIAWIGLGTRLSDDIFLSRVTNFCKFFSTIKLPLATHHHPLCLGSLCPHQPTNQPTNKQTTKQPTNQPTNQPTKKQPTNQPTNQPTSKQRYKQTDKNKSTNR